MKRKNLAFVFAALLSLAPFAMGQEASNAALNKTAPVAVSGNWTLYYDWNCTGSYGTLPMTLNSNGTWSGDGFSGNWAVIGGTAGATTSAAGMLTFNFVTAKTAYSGVLSSKSVTGTQSTFGGLNGCFFMLQAGAPVAASEETPNAKPENAAGER